MGAQVIVSIQKAVITTQSNRFWENAFHRLAKYQLVPSMSKPEPGGNSEQEIN
jgi:hypothetical protein